VFPGEVDSFHGGVGVGARRFTRGAEAGDAEYAPAGGA
jgi:hypothetical protein